MIEVKAEQYDGSQESFERISDLFDGRNVMHWGDHVSFANCLLGVGFVRKGEWAVLEDGHPEVMSDDDFNETYRKVYVKKESVDW